MIILLVFFVVMPLLLRFLRPYIQRWLMGRMEDAMRRRMGMPTRKEEERMRREASRSGSSASSSRASRDTSDTYSRQRQYSYRRGHGDPIIPKEYAEDVEFTEVKTYSQTDISGGDVSHGEYHESQVEDAEYVEIKDKKNR